MQMIKKILLSLILISCSLFATEFEIVFNDNDFFSDDDLYNQIGEVNNLEDLPINRVDFLMKLSRSSIEMLYHQEGFFNAQVGLAEKIDPESDTKTFTFNIFEGDRFKFNLVEIQVSKWGKVLADVSKLKTYKKDDYSIQDINKDQQKLRSIYWENGFLHVKVSYRIRIDSLKNIVDLKFYIDPKAQAKMGEVHTETSRAKSRHHRKDSSKVKSDSTSKSEMKPGLTDIDYLTSLWTISKNQVIDGNYFVEFRSKLYATRIFSQVKLKDSLNQETGLVDIYLSTVEKTPGKSVFSYFYEPTFGNGVSALTKHKNVFGRFHEASAMALVAQRKQELIFGYGTPMLFGASVRFIPTPIRLESRIVTLREKLPLLSNIDSLEERYEIANESSLSFGLNKYMKYRFTTDLRQVINVTADDRFLKLNFDNALDINFTNSIVSPTKGARFIPSIGNGGKITKENNFSEKRYWYGQLKTRYYIPTFSWLELAFAADIGKFFQKGIEDDVRAYFPGGSRSVRGYRMYSIYPYKTIPDPDNPGETIRSPGLQPFYQRLSQELRFKLPGRSLRNFRIVEFMDWAFVQDEDSSFPSQRKGALGLGLRYHWEILTIRFDYTFKKDFKDFWRWEEFEWGRISFDLAQAI